MLETVLRAVASLIVVTCLILWLGKSASTGGFAAKLFARFGNTGAPMRPGAKANQSKRKPSSASLLKTWGAKFTGTAGGANTTGAVMTVAARQILMGTSGVAIVDIDGQRLVLGVTESQVSLITTLQTPQPSAVAGDQALAPELLGCPELSGLHSGETETERGPNVCDVAKLEAAELEAARNAELTDFAGTTGGAHTFAGGQIYPATPKPLRDQAEESQGAPANSVVDFEIKLRDCLAAHEPSPLDVSESRIS